MKTALDYAEKQLAVELYCMGEDSPDYQDTLRFVEGLREKVRSARSGGPSLDVPKAFDNASHERLVHYQTMRETL